MTGGRWRLPSGGRVSRDEPLHFTFDGRGYDGVRGDTLASALLANGVHHVATSVRLGRPRGIVSAGGEEPTAVVQVEAPFPEPLRPATTLELYDGLVASSVAARGRLADRPDPARYDAMHAHCDVLVVGAGPAGLATATVAARSGARVVVVDDRPAPGGSLADTTESGAGSATTEWASSVADELRAGNDVRLLSRTTALGCYDHNYVVAVERRTEHLGAAAPPQVSRERIWRIRARHVVLATGAHERHLAFAGNDRPGVMLAGAARAYVHRYGVLPGRRAVVLAGDDSAYAAAADLAAVGVDVVAVADPRPAGAAPSTATRCTRIGIEVLTGHGVVAVHGERRVGGASLAPLRGGHVAGEVRDLDADLLLVSGGWSPVLALYGQAGGRARYDTEQVCFRPDGFPPGLQVAGGANGTRTLAAALRDGQRAGVAALEATGFSAPPLPDLPEVAEEVTPVAPTADLVLPGLVAHRYPTHFVDLARDVTVDDVLRATGAGLRSVEHVKRFTTAGTGHDQGKTSALLTSAVLARALSVEVGTMGVTASRPPFAPVSFAALAGRDREMLHDPVRVTAMHGWHVAHGAVFENVGQWSRPRYFPRAVASDGGLSGEDMEDMETAVLRECRAAREGVAFMDASTLGKIELHGADAGIFLDRLYTNVMSSLAVGSIRYGVMCRADGMVFDDGTVIRLAEDRFLVTTTTGNAAAVLDWMEEWLQTEWPDLRVHATSVTEQWATAAVVGPGSRTLLAHLTDGVDLDAERFPFMTWRDAEVAGIPARVCRISFSGELAYEVNVSWWDGLALWEAVETAGESLDLTPYGTETMHVLRAEKGYPIVGQDTDGTVTPHDLGMGWVVSKKKPDFVGKRSFTRVDTSRADRKALVGLLPEDRRTVLPEGTQLVAADEHDQHRAPNGSRVPMLGHVTSSYRSAALERPFALALVKGGRGRIGEVLHAAVGDSRVPVTVTGHVLYDPEGARRDG